MQDPVLAAFVKQLTDGGESTAAGGGGWACGEECGEIKAVGDVGGHDVDTPKGTCRIKEGGLDKRGGDLFCAKQRAAFDFFQSTIGVGV